MSELTDSSVLSPLDMNVMRDGKGHRIMLSLVRAFFETDARTLADRSVSLNAEALAALLVLISRATPRSAGSRRSGDNRAFRPILVEAPRSPNRRGRMRSLIRTISAHTN